MNLILIILLSSVGMACPKWPVTSTWTKTFEDNMDAPKVVGQTGVGTWFTGAGVGTGEIKNPPITDTRFHNYSSATPGVLKLESYPLYDSLGVYKKQWAVAEIQSVDKTGQGFTMSEGCAEARMKFAPGRASWPALWARSLNYTTDATHLEPGAELDTIEWYGGDPKGMHSTLHLHHSTVPKVGCYSGIKNSVGVYLDLSQAYHRYGFCVDGSTYKTYFDGQLQCEFDMDARYPRPFYLILSQSVFEPQVSPLVTLDTLVDYVRVWKKP